jgi:hypothetical protein
VEEHRVYLLFDKINPRLRGVVSVILIVTGFLIQLSTRSILAGIPFILICAGLNLIKGISIKRPRSYDLKWQEVTPDKIEQVLRHCRRVKKFQSQNLGCFIIAAFVLVFVFAFFHPVIKDIPLSFPATVTIINAVVLFAGLIISGRKNAWAPRALDIKAEIVKRVMQTPMVSTDPGIKPIPFMEIGQTPDGSFPNDMRILFRFNDAPDTFVGLQAQISINAVKSTMYPYFYTVIIARPQFNLFDKFESLGVALEGITIETKRSNDVDVIVLRQTTTKTSGYHTNNEVQQYILSRSIELVKRIL